MIKVFKSLAQVSTGYSVFERDQLLTHMQLNSIADYCGDQTRLTRVKLLGVGIVCGLRVSTVANLITVSKGVGITTDGDLLSLPGDTVFDRYIEYAAASPFYQQFFVGDNRIALYELVPKDPAGGSGSELSSFSVNTGKSLNTMAALLYAETYINDPDLCSGTDCDNLGQDYISRIKVLLVEKSSLANLNPFIPTPDHSARTLNEISADRPVLTSSATSPTLVMGAYQTACKSIAAKLALELPNLYKSCSWFLSDMFPSDPWPGWKAQFDTFSILFATSTAGIQYYYDFLKDVVETWNTFRSLLFGERTMCSPDVNWFPKHVLLGNVVTGTNADENRTQFYPSSLASRTSEQFHHARFLAKKLDQLIQLFKVPSTTTIRITPSRFEDDDLGERAIPYYYKIDANCPICKSWNFALSQKGMEAYNYSYNASLYGALGGAASPLTSQIGRFPFFRIEGHLGQNVSTAISTIESEIQSKCLPITVRSVSLGTDTTKVVRKSSTRYSDMHRFHYILRQDTLKQLTDVASVSKTFKENVDKISEDEENAETLKVLAAEKQDTVASKVTSAIPKLKLSFSKYSAADPAWKSDLNGVMKAAGELKSYLGDVTKTDFPTAIDSLLSSTHIRWLDWADTIIKKKDEQEDEKLLFSKFISLHPGAEHFGGVARGGTFILAYDSNNNVVADFMLPYSCCETAEEETEEPDLPEPSVKTDLPSDKGIRIVQSISKTIDKIISPKLTGIKETIGSYKDSVSVLAGVVSKTTTTESATEEVTDSLLDAKKEAAAALRKKVAALKTEAVKVGITDAEKSALDAEAAKAETALASAAADVAEHLSKTDAEVSEGTEGYKALQEVADSIAAISTASTVATVVETLKTVSTTGTTTTAKTVIGKVASRFVK